MLDCGFSIKETQHRLSRLGRTPEDISGIVVTHEHADHVGGVFKFARRYEIPVWLTYGTFQAVGASVCKDVDLHFCRDSEAFRIGDLTLQPYTVPHDAREPVQFVATDGDCKLGVLTDAGQSTGHLLQALGGCDALVLECNHDRQMLADSVYPPSLKRRIGGPYGHLANDISAEILAALDKHRLKMVVGAHLSLKNNTPDLARAALTTALDQHSAEVMIACQEQGFDWIVIA
ncbi:phosphoribosyl 1,2-cyclic phosphodiesterase [Herbaspirillum sp. Sphag1AN]|nr:phosphoribosyl 1,2-cyclic phosphodiesterase [Herbaspirillum sp. Sphag1AN]MBB3244880.1 phosphoribosyl 1,2-cyclic phosphodiesterase [Herbaspirillum sp. Sphag64]